MPEDKDIREEILHNLVISDKYFKDDMYSKELIFDAMDERARRMCMELLEWMGLKNITCCHDREGVYFIVDVYGESKTLTKEELFSNFL